MRHWAQGDVRASLSGQGALVCPVYPVARPPRQGILPGSKGIRAKALSGDSAGMGASGACG